MPAPIVSGEFAEGSRLPSETSIAETYGVSSSDPDAPTERGRRHVEELAYLAATGVRAAALRTAVVFIIQRPDAISIAPNRETDPAFADALAQAQEQGVELYAYTCGVTTSRVWLEREVPVVVG